jgi:hypothetical protein
MQAGSNGYQWRDSANGATAQMILNSAGNLGLGVTPSAWSGAGPVVEVGTSKGNAFRGAGINDANVESNAYYNAGWKYANTGYANRYAVGNGNVGGHYWYNAASGTAGNAITFTQAMTLDASGNLGVGTSSPSYRLDASASAGNGSFVSQITNSNTASDGRGILRLRGYNGAQVNTLDFAGGRYFGANDDSLAVINNAAAGGITFNIGGVSNGTQNEAMRIDSSKNLLVGKTAATFATAGSYMSYTGKGVFTVNADEVMLLNRLTDDGNLIRFYQASTEEGNISVSGTTVSYNGGHLSRWAQTTTAKDESLVKGTVLSNLDEMNVYTDDEGNPVDNEQLNKVKVSDTEGDVNVAGVFVNWSHDEQHNVDEINMAMTGDMIIRIAQGVTVVRGDLLMSAGDGTAKPQGDDIVRSKTVAKVTSNHITCTYADGSYCVPCVLMAC